MSEPPREGKHFLAGDLHSATVNVELRHLRYFVAVAEELHFTRAARRVHIAQQPLSAAIARLEQQLGVTLLARTTRRVELTPAGEALLEPARAALRAIDEALAAAQEAGRGHAGELGVGLSSGAWYGLEPGDRGAQRLLGDVHAAGGPGEVQLLGHGDEVAQVPQLHIHSRGV